MLCKRRRQGKYAVGIWRQGSLRTLVALLQGLNWNAHHLDSHIEEAMRLTRVVSDTLGTVKGNIGRIEDALRRLLKTPMFERKEGKVRLCDVVTRARLF